MTTRVLLALALAALGGAGTAAPIYRCGPDGRTFSQAPCAEGRLVEASDPRTAAQRADAKRQLAREKKAAADAQRERKAVEAAATPAIASSVSPAAAAPVNDAKPEKKKEKKAKATATAGGDKAFIAVVPKKNAAK